MLNDFFSSYGGKEYAKYVKQRKNSKIHFLIYQRKPLKITVLYSLKDFSKQKVISRSPSCAEPKYIYSWYVWSIIASVGPWEKNRLMVKIWNYLKSLHKAVQNLCNIWNIALFSVLCQPSLVANWGSFLYVYLIVDVLNPWKKQKNYKANYEENDKNIFI